MKDDLPGFAENRVILPRSSFILCGVAARLV